MDFLEKKIKEQRENFDQIERVDEGLLWQNIQAELPAVVPKKSRRVRRFLQIYAVAASVALLMMACWIFSNKQHAVVTPMANAVEKFVPEFEEEENYRQLVSEKKEDLDFENIDRNSFKDIFFELELLENVRREFESDLPAIDDQEKAIEVLQKYYERKIRILERLSKEIEKKSHYEKRINEKPM